MPAPAYPTKEYKLYIERQNILRGELPAYDQSIRHAYQNCSSELKNQLKAHFQKELSALNGDEKTALVLVDIQNSFTLSNFGLAAPGGENTIITNVQLLDALRELFNEQPALKKRLDIITSQDAHIADRDQHCHAEDTATIEKAYSDKSIRQEHTKNEKSELDDVYGKHCIIGTPDAAIASLIKQKLDDLGTDVHAFAKMTFGPQSGMKLQANINIGDEIYFEGKKSILDPNAIAYDSFVADKKYKKIFMTGICANVCVEQAALNFAKHAPIEVIDPCVHYLVLPHLEHIKTYDISCQATKLKYDANNNSKQHSITCFKVEGYRSNPSELPQHEQAEQLYRATKLKELVGAFKANTQQFSLDRLFNTETAKAANTLNKKLDAALSKFMEKDDKQSIQSRKTALLKDIHLAIREAAPVLNQHPAWQKTIAQFISALTSILSLGIANVILNRSFFSVVQLSKKQPKAFEKATELEEACETSCDEPYMASLPTPAA